MNSTTEYEEMKELLRKLGTTEKANAEEIINYKKKLEITNDEISLIKSKLNFYENRVEELITGIEDTKWNQTKAKVLLKSHKEFVSQQILKNQISASNQTVNIKEDDIREKISKLKEEKEHLEKQCNTNDADEILQVLHDEYKKLQIDCEIHQTQNNL